ncbi:Alpha/Beta hydrolase protein [Pyrenochaeta sp. MPI-SDFR-AT-0127]|nr:Alpha/Beta hydrolase protein [Pyrenochaeta sp. MPI-SDFR-AT-0127]
MSSKHSDDPTALTESFHYENATHSYDIKWCQLGNPASPPLIFVHGTSWSSRVWVPFALGLARQFHVYLFDNPGFGASPLEVQLLEKEFDPADEVTKLDADLARQSAVFSALFKTWEKEWSDQRAHVIAHDHGGLMSLRAYLLHNCQYASLCLIDVVAIGPFGQPLFTSAAENPTQFQQLPKTGFKDILDSYIRNAAFFELPSDFMQMLRAPWLRERGREGFIRQLCQANSRSTEAVEGRYGEFGQEVPILILWGAQDSWEAGHLAMYDQPAQLGLELGRWLGTFTRGTVELHDH